MSSYYERIVPMRRKKTQEQPFTQEQYEAVLADFADERTRLDDAYLAARRRGEVDRCKDIYEWWLLIVQGQREFLLTHPAP
jgi:hypothetical protein